MFNTATTATPPAPPLPRHALGLPAGSVRALLALSVLGALWLIVIKLDDPKLHLIFVYLNILMVLILAHYFSAHGHTIGSHISTGSPLGLPSGTVRLVLVLGYAGMAYFFYKHQPEFEIPPKANIVLLTALLLSGFFVGHYLTICVKVLSGGTLPYWFQDLQAWTALLAIIALAVLLVIHCFINTSVSPDMTVNSVPVDTVLAALVGFYFGSRT